MENNEDNKMSLELRPEVAAGTYSNLAIITHSHSEFIIDFAKMLPGMPKPDICSRINNDSGAREETVGGID